MGAVQSTANKPKRVQHSTFWDALSEVIFTGECLVKMEHYPPDLIFHKVGEQQRNKAGNKGYRDFVLILVISFQFQSNSTRQAISLFGHNLGHYEHEIDKKMQGGCLLSVSKKK